MDTFEMLSIKFDSYNQRQHKTPCLSKHSWSIKIHCRHSESWVRAGSRMRLERNMLYICTVLHFLVFLPPLLNLLHFITS